MTGPGQFCPECGSPRGTASHFCTKCGTRFHDGNSLEQAAGACQEIASAAKSVGSAADSASGTIRAAGEIKNFVIAPPATWKVVVGDRLPGTVDAMATRASDAAVQKMAGTVAGEAERAAKSMLAGSNEGKGSRQPAAVPDDTGPCPGCGKPVSAGAKFCGSCGASIPRRAGRSCPSCGAPVRNGVKFCGSCGRKVD